MTRRVLLSYLLLALAAPVVSSADSSVPDPDLSTATVEGSGPFLVSPGGLGDELGALGLTIEVRLVLSDGSPVIGYPFQDVWIEGVSGTAFLCPGGMVADLNSDVEGRMTLSSAVRGGGWTGDPAGDPSFAGVQVIVGNVPIGVPLPLQWNSADIDGDALISITDISAFSQDFVGAYHFRTDLDHNGRIDLGDVGVFAAQFGVSNFCP